MTTLFFATGTGRCGTMWLANLLNSETNTIALHEGKTRVLEEEGEQYIPFLTLQNRQAYDAPSSAHFLFKKYRSGLSDIASQHDSSIFGDVAYNYAPFVSAIHKQYPQAKLIYLYRNGIDFVRSCTTDLVPDPVPVGWPPKNKKLSKLERYISLGRLKPSLTDPLHQHWDSLSVVAKNAWLWAETNRIILQQLESVTNENVIPLRFESFVKSPEQTYQKIRSALGINKELSAETRTLIERPINKREQKLLPKWDHWTQSDKNDFTQFAESMMLKLGYDLE